MNALSDREKELTTHSEVEILLATFNGERFLREQIDSLLTQNHVNLRILARDDGSKDDTVKILNEYSQRYPDRFRLMETGAPTGSAKENFLRLMQNASAEYVCFADQDDIWLPDKVSQTIHAMHQLESKWGKDTPLLVFTDLRVVDAQLKTLHPSLWAHEGIIPDHIHRLARLLPRNVVTGCTAMLNRRLLEIGRDMPKEVVMHDHWIALLASVAGKTDIVKKQTVLYRQHDRNVIGARKNRSLLEHIMRIFVNDARMEQWQATQRQAQSLLKIHAASLSPEDRRLLRAYLRCGTDPNRFIRIATLIRHGFFRSRIIENVATAVDLWRMNIPAKHRKE